MMRGGGQDARVEVAVAMHLGWGTYYTERSTLLWPAASMAPAAAAEFGRRRCMRFGHMSHSGQINGDLWVS